MVSCLLSRVRDDHPSHRSKGLSVYFLTAPSVNKQLGPPYKHEFVGTVEVQFMHHVPAANALLMQSPDLNGRHFVAALFASLAASEFHAIGEKADDGSERLTSIVMRYYRHDKWVPNPYYVFGSVAKSLIHPEERAKSRTSSAQRRWSCMGVLTRDRVSTGAGLRQRVECASLTSMGWHALH